ncbi:hypothetical protein [Nocardioides dongxiaopingii]|uniref:hypothetical protein n=1 Tax=Nocardioides dongxiaopingii TaxID=2576036 RepID=UPI0010C76E8F|nr:hypothetical protein [Nocardioides dongxiaopingii]
MPSTSSQRLRPLVVVATALLLLVGLAGTSYAAVSLARNSVLSKHIKDGQVRTPDLAKNSVTGAKVKNRSLRADDFARGQLPAGPRGPRGVPGPVRTVTVVSAPTAVAVGGFGYATVRCPAGTQALGGGPTLSNASDMVVTSSFPLVRESDPIGDPAGQYGPSTGWRAYARNNGGSAGSLQVAVVCGG